MSRNYSVQPSWRILFEQHRHSDLRWVTIIIGAIRVTEQDTKSPSAREAIQKQVQAMIARFQADWLALTRGRHLSGMIWRGVYELELHQEIPPGSHRFELLESLGNDVTPLAKDERYLVVHTHFVISLGKKTETQLRNNLARWRGKWQTMVKGLYDDQTVEEAVTNLCSYCYKNKLEYSTGGLNNVPVQYVAPYGIVWGRFVSLLYRGFDREFRSKK